MIWLSILAGVAIVAFLTAWSRRNAGPPPRSIHLLLTRPRVLDEAELRAAAARAWSVTFSGAPDAQEFVTGRDGMFLAKARGHVLSVSMSPQPGSRNPAAMARTIRDAKKRAAYADHRAFIALISHHAPEAETLGAIYAHMGKLAAELLADDCLAVMVPERDSLVVASSDLAAQLRKDDLLAGAPELFLPAD
jgi:hypothetical protein